jgi:hypothetical protein
VGSVFFAIIVLWRTFCGRFFFSYFAYQLLEYNYAAAVYQHTRHSEEYTYGPIDSESKSYADALTHNFGQIQTLIFSLLFLVQVLFASGILRRIGVMQTYALAPLFSFFSFAAMFIHPAFFYDHSGERSL